MRYFSLLRYTVVCVPIVVSLCSLYLFIPLHYGSFLVLLRDSLSGVSFWLDFSGLFYVLLLEFLWTLLCSLVFI